MSVLPRIASSELVGVLGMVPTPSTADADHWSCENSVDLDQTAAMTRLVVEGGVRILLTNGSLGEGATLLEHEQRDFTACTLRASPR
jgi:4-(2-carboxyphenyl)-2-oxobut-3-enoate aldolase